MSDFACESAHRFPMAAICSFLLNQTRTFFESGRCSKVNFCGRHRERKDKFDGLLFGVKLLFVRPKVLKSQRNFVQW